jgi:perosamine synthetase
MKISVAKPYLTEEEAKAAYDTVLSHWVTQGPKVEEFEKNFAAYVGSTYAVAVSSCTAALHLSLLAAGIKKDDEVICPSFSFIATANSIIMVGAIPVFAEINSETLNLDIDEAKKLITRKTKSHSVGTSNWTTGRY